MNLNNIKFEILSIGNVLRPLREIEIPVHSFAKGKDTAVNLTRH